MSNTFTDKLTLLTVDDSKTNHKIVKKMLGDEFNVESVYSGRECLGYIKNSKPQLILLDVTMPDMDGYETCKLIKADSSTQSIPVLFLSGRCSIEEKLRGYEVGADDYITKPFEEKELSIKIKKAIEVAQKNQKLHQRAEIATQAIAQAVRVSSNITTCMRFMGGLASVHSIQELVSLFFQATRELGLSSTLHLNTSNSPLTFFEDSIEKELEVELFRRIPKETVFVALGRRLIVQFAEAQYLIKNMPELPERELETLKSYILTLLEGFHTRWHSLQVEEGIRRQREVLGITLLKAKELIDKMASNTGMVITNSNEIFEAAFGSIEQAIAEFGLNETQEQKVLAEVKKIVTNMDSVHASLLKEDKNILSLSADLEKVVNAMSKSIDRDCGLAGG